MLGKDFEGANYLLEKNWGQNTILMQRPLWFMAFIQHLESQKCQARKDLRVNLVRLTHVMGDGTEKQRDSWTAMSEATQCHRPRQMKHPDSQAKALSPTSPPSTPGKCLQTSSLLSKACSWALYCWHFLWQISVTTKGYTVNARGQILKLAYFHNHHFLRGEGPFSGSLKTSGF